ncbi:hypothetical protein [Paenibacillus oryzisoli]|uniref:Uncharacterized protein n=1 Tax=Paenibacillus oryzisoli TaxID=1850517 RepID=A0A198ACP5_9BACL|nr:hypothetical protein [Paenibacillus oryzisoli]OAS19269.1 hypothetical protein A8708_26530 [Paenibacillus oryzisoli]
MIDEQTLLQWIEKKRHVFGGPYDDSEKEEDIQKYEGALMMLRLLKQEIAWGHFKKGNGE